MRNRIIALIALLFLGSPAWGSFSYEGYLTDSSGNALPSATTYIKVAILTSNDCVIYEEEHANYDTTATNGYFHISIGDGTGTPTYTNGMSFDSLFVNGVNISGQSACSQLPAAGLRKMKVSVKLSGGGSYESFADINLHSAPTAGVAAQVGTHTPASLLRVESAGVASGVNAINPAQFAELNALLGGTSTQYAKSSTGAGTIISGYSGNIGSPSPGSVWLDTSINQIKYSDASGTIQTLSTGGGGGITGLTGDVLGSGVGTISVTIGASTVNSAKIADGTVTGTDIQDASITGNDISASSNLSITSMTVGGTLTTNDLSTNTIGTRSISLFENPGNGTNYITVQAPTSLPGNMIYTWPATYGTNGYVLSTDGSGGLAWSSNGGGGGITQITGDISASGSGSVTGTISNNAVTFAKIQSITDNRILGRSAGSAGVMQELTVGSGLSLTGGVLSAIGAASDASYAVKGAVQFDTNASTSGIYINAGLAKLANSGVTAGTYGTASMVPAISVDAFGRVVNVTTNPLVLNAAMISSGLLPVARGGTNSGTVLNNNRIMVSSGGAIVESAALTSGQFLVGTGSLPAVVSMSGDATMTGGGVVTVDASSSNAVNKIVRRDGSGNFIAGTGTFNSSIKVTDGAVGGQVTIATPVGFSSYNLTLPTTAGSASQVLTTNGLGVLSWQSVAPAPALLLDGSTNMTGPIKAMSSSTASSPAYAFVGDTSTGLFRPGANTIAVALGGSERVRFTNAGFVGIGTSAPQTSLHIATNGTPAEFTAEGTGGAGGAFIARAANGPLATPTQTMNGDILGKFGAKGRMSSGGYTPSPTAFIAMYAEENLTTANQGTSMAFYTTDIGSNSPTERLRIYPDGNIGLGLMSPSALLHLRAGLATPGGAPIKFTPGSLMGTTEAGALEFDGNNLTITNNAGSRRVITTNNSAAVFTGITVSSDILPVSNNTVKLGSSSYAWNSIYSYTAVNVTSDRRKKKEIEDSDLGLDFIQKLRPVSYKMRKGDDSTQYGLIAQEVEQALKESKESQGKALTENMIVAYDKESDTYSLKYTDLISPIIKAIKELYAKFLAQDQEIARLKAENAAIKAHLCSQERVAGLCE